MKTVTGLCLEKWLGVEAAFWMNLQNRYDLELATEKYGEKIKKTVQRVPLRLLFKPSSLS